MPRKQWQSGQENRITPAAGWRLTLSNSSAQCGQTGSGVAGAGSSNGWVFSCELIDDFYSGDVFPYIAPVANEGNIDSIGCSNGTVNGNSTVNGTISADGYCAVPRNRGILLLSCSVICLWLTPF